MYKRYKQGISTVEDVLERSISNLSVVDLKQDSAPVPEEEPADSPPQPELDPEVVNTVEVCWDQIGSQCVDYGNQTKFKTTQDEGKWRTVRVFVSSTFTDFFCEREVLVKQVFPELREWCRERMLYLIECDMRWGVPKDSTTADTISICLEELDRCMEETGGQAFFLNMIGERYGWIPALDDIPQAVREKFSWVPNTSITFMEILHGAYRMQNPNALFMLRDNAIMKDIPEQYLTRFKDLEPLQVLHLQEMKSRLQTRFPDQLHEYTCTMDGLVQKHEKEMVSIGSLDGFCSKVLEFFKAAIERTFPNRESIDQTESRVLQENANQTTFMEEIAGTMSGRKLEVEQIMSYFRGDYSHLKEGELSKPFSRDNEFWEDFLDFENPILFLSGQPGHGKTTLMASVTKQCVQKSEMVFYHFCGSTGESKNVSLLQQRLLAFFEQNFSSDYLGNVYQMDELQLKEALRDGILAFKDSNPEKSVIIILDALDQLSTSDTVHHLNWLPPKFPGNIRCIVSSSNQPVTVSRIQEHQHYKIQLEDLSKDDAKEIIQMFLLRFNKKLDADQLNLILESKCSESPLWLYLVCEELRVYGDFRSLNKQIKSVTSSFEGMVAAILERIIGEDDTGFVGKTLCLLACSYGTVTTLDLQRMLGDITCKEPLALLTWGHIKRSLSTFLRVANYDDQITFVHDRIREVVYKTLIKSDSEALNWHKLLADYIQYWSEDKTLRMEALPYHLQQARLRRRLVDFVRKIPESARIPPFRRSGLMTNCRCRNLADPIIHGVSPVNICTFCRHGRACYHPWPFHSNEDMCVVCGNQVFNGPFSSPAHICQYHGVHNVGGITRCFLCDTVVDKKMMVQGKLCQNCGFGNNGKMCAALDTHL